MNPNPKPTEQMTRPELVAAIQRMNPFGSYCVKPCKHPGHSDDAYRRTVRKMRGEV